MLRMFGPIFGRAFFLCTVLRRWHCHHTNWTQNACVFAVWLWHSDLRRFSHVAIAHIISTALSQPKTRKQMPFNIFPLWICVRDYENIVATIRYRHFVNAALSLLRSCTPKTVCDWFFAVVRPFFDTEVEQWTPFKFISETATFLSPQIWSMYLKSERS